MCVEVCFNLNWYPLATQEHCWHSPGAMTGELKSVTFNCRTGLCFSSGEGLDWTFSTVMFWGEAQIAGTWTLIVRDSSKN